MIYTPAQPHFRDNRNLGKAPSAIAQKCAGNTVFALADRIIVGVLSELDTLSFPSNAAEFRL
jgi:hypothetical protein